MRYWSRRKRTDLPLIRADYERGDRLKDIVRRYAVCETVVCKWARREGWSKPERAPKPKRIGLPFDPNACSRCQCSIPDAPAAYPRKRTCPPCRRLLGLARTQKRRANNPEVRRIERKRIAEKGGRLYRTRAEISEAAKAKHLERERQRLSRPRSLTEAQWIARLQSELPELYDESKSVDALAWRARYYLDPVFKAKAIQRLHEKKNRDVHKRELLSDGSLTPEVIRQLFACATSCPYCGHGMRSQDKSLDHIWPRDSGGWHSVANVLVCCKRCNARKRRKTPEQWLGELPAAQRHTVARIYRAKKAQPWLVA